MATEQENIASQRRKEANKRLQAQLKASWLNREEFLRQKREQIWVEWWRKLKSFVEWEDIAPDPSIIPTEEWDKKVFWESFSWTGTTTLDTTIPSDTITPTDTTTETVDDLTPWIKTLKEQVTDINVQKTREQRLKDARAESWRWELVELQKWFREEARAVQEDIENIRKWLAAEWWAITSIAASRIREARSTPLREQLVSLVKWQELTSANIAQVDQSIDGILEARKLDRQDEVRNLTNQIEGSDLSSEEKNRLLTQLWTTSARKEQEEELEAFKQKEQIKADIKKADEESIAKTWLTAEQNLSAAKIIQDFDVKEDSIAWQAIRKLLKEWKTSEQIRKIIWLAEWPDWVIDDETFTRQEKLRKEFEGNTSVKNYLEATQQFSWILSSLWTATWPWDMAAIFQFMKVLDPSSVVRESEFAAAAASVWLWERAFNILDKATKWTLFTQEARKQFVTIAKQLFENRKDAFDERASKFITLAREAWANPKSVVLDFDNIPWVATDLTDEDLQALWGNSTDEELIQGMNQWAFSGGAKFNQNNIWEATDKELWDLLDDDPNFNGADQTALTKVWISNIGLWTVTQTFWATSPLEIDNVRLADGSVWTPWIDIDGKIWDSIPSTVSWTVKIVKSDTWLWNRVIITDEQWNEHFFNHLDWFNVEDWQTITKWQQLWTMWNSWTVIAWPWGDGSHLDYRVKSAEWWIDPNKFLNS